MPFLKPFKLPKYNKFEYKPRYWNPKKEELENRLKLAEGMNGNDTDAIKARIQYNLRRNKKVNKSLLQRQRMRSNLMLIAIVAILIVLTYMILVVYLPQIEKFLGPQTTGQ